MNGAALFIYVCAEEITRKKISAPPPFCYKVPPPYWRQVSIQESTKLS